MKTILSWQFSCLLSLTALAVVGHSLPARADTNSPDQIQHNLSTLQPTDRTTALAAVRAPKPVPIPGTTVTSAAALIGASPVTPEAAKSDAQIPHQIAQAVGPVENTTSVPSYVGVAGNIGLSGGNANALGIGSFTLISKVTILRNISIRPTAVIGDNNVVLIPVTFDIPIQRFNVASTAIRFAPYIGGGIAINTGNNSDTGGLLSAGIDFPLTPQFTATAGLNVGFINDTSIGLLFGIGYNFSGPLFGL